jgi:O-antigen/teichoic acid export membrane protein
MIELSISRVRVSRIVGSRFRRNVIVTSTIGLATYSLGMVTGPLLSRSLGPSGRGELAAVLVPAQLSSFFISFGLPSAAAYLALRVNRGTLLATSTAFGLIIGTPLVLVVWPFLPMYYQHHTSATLFWAYAFLVTTPMSVGTGAALDLLRSYGAGVRWNVWRVAPTVLAAILVLTLFVSSKLTLTTALAASFVGNLSMTVLLVWGAFEWRPLRVSLRVLRSQVSYGARVAIGSLAETLSGRFDQAVLVTLVPPSELGLYAVAVTAAGISGPLASSLGLALFPELRQDDSPNGQGRRTRMALLVVITCSTVFAIAMAVFGPWLLTLLFGQEFREATTSLRILVVGQVAYDAMHPLAARLLAANRPGSVSKASVIAGSITIVGLVIAVPRFGIAGAAMTTTISYLLRFLYGALALRHSTRGQPESRRYRPE